MPFWRSTIFRERDGWPLTIPKMPSISSSETGSLGRYFATRVMKTSDIVQVSAGRVARGKHPTTVDPSKQVPISYPTASVTQIRDFGWLAGVDDRQDRDGDLSQSHRPAQSPAGGHRVSPLPEAQPGPGGRQRKDLSTPPGRAATGRRTEQEKKTLLRSIRKS